MSFLSTIQTPTPSTQFLHNILIIIKVESLAVLISVSFSSTISAFIKGLEFSHFIFPGAISVHMTGLVAHEAED